MVSKPLPFVVKKRPKFRPPKMEQRHRRALPMTLVAALSGRDGTILFADTQETVGNYGIKKIDKLASWDCEAFRLGIAGASTDGTYSDMLQSEILAGLSSLTVFEERQIISRLGEILTGFYSKHIWPRTGDKPQMEYLLVVQPIP